MAQNFEAIISAKAVGTADVQAQADAMRKLAESIDNLGQKANKVNEHPGFAAFAEKVKAGIENPLKTIGDEAEKALKALGPFGTAVAAAAGTFAVVGVAAFEAAKSLGEYGTQIQNIALRTGLTAKEVGQFSFAARAAGQDVGVFESAMRKLSQGLDDNSAEGAKARKGLTDLGVVTRDATGALRPMSDIFLQISTGLHGIEDPAKRNTEALRLFGRAGIELVPTILGLNENIKRAKELGLGATDEDLKRWEEYHRNVVEAEEIWERFTRKIKEPLAAIITVMFRDSGGHNYTLDELRQRGVNLGGFAPRTQEGDEAAARAAGFGSQMTGFNRNIRNSQLDAYTDRIAARQNADAAIGRLFSGQSVEDQLKEAEKSLGDLARPTKGSSSMEDVNTYSAAQQKVAALKAQVEAAKELEAALKSLAAWERQMAQKDMDPVTKIFFERDQQANATQQYGRATDAALLPAQAALNKMRDADAKQTLETFGKSTNALDKNYLEWANKQIEDMNRGSANVVRNFLEWQQATKHVADELHNIDVQSERSNIMALSGKTLSMMNFAFGPGQDASAIAATFAERKRLASALYDFELEHARTYIDQEKAFADWKRATQDAEIEHELKIAELQRRRIEEFRSEMGGVFDALLGGKNGIQQFAIGEARTLGRAAFSNIATDIFKTHDKMTPGNIFGGTWLGNIFNDKQGGDTHLNTIATAENTQAIRALTARISMSPSGGGGGFSPMSASMVRALAGGGSSNGDDLSSALGDFDSMHPNGYWAPTGGQPLPSSGGSNFSLARGIGIGAAALGSGFGIYSGINSGGARGALTASGSALAGAGAIAQLISPALTFAGPAGAIAGLVLGSIIPSLFGDPRQQRANDLQQQRVNRAYTEPTGADYSVDIYGRSVDYAGGGMRPIVVYQSNTISAIDGPSLEQHLLDNPTALTKGISAAISGGNGEDVMGTIRQNL